MLSIPLLVKLLKAKSIKVNLPKKVVEAKGLELVNGFNSEELC